MHALGHWRISRAFHDLVFHPGAPTAPERPATAQLPPLVHASWGGRHLRLTYVPVVVDMWVWVLLVVNTGVTVPTSQLMLQQPESDLVTTIGASGGFRSVRFWHDQLFAKPPHHGGNVAWYVLGGGGVAKVHGHSRPAGLTRALCEMFRHQDYSYWTRTRPMNHMVRSCAVCRRTLLHGPSPFRAGVCV